MDTQVTQNTPQQGYVEQQAGQVFSAIKESVGGPSLERQLKVIGAKSLREATKARKLMDVSVKKALPELSGDSPLAKLINEATIKTAELNPNAVKNSFLYKIPVPFIRKKLLASYVENFQSQSSKVESIFENLNDGKEHLLERMIELEEQYIHLKGVESNLDQDIEVAKAVQAQLDEVDTSELDKSEVQKYNKAQERVARRLRDIQTVKAAIYQFFISIDQTFNVQEQLNSAIDSILEVGPMVLQNAIMINSAINSQKQVAEAVGNASATIGNALKQNAEMVEDNAKNVAELYNNPVIALDDISESFAKLENAVAITNEAQSNAITASRNMTDELEAMNDKFKGVAENLNSEGLDFNPKASSSKQIEDKSNLGEVA